MKTIVSVEAKEPADKSVQYSDITIGTAFIWCNGACSAKRANDALAQKGIKLTDRCWLELSSQQVHTCDANCTVFPLTVKSITLLY